MSGEAHINLLKKGASLWNKWRAENSQTRPVLRGANLDGTDLRGFDLAFMRGFGGGVDFRNVSLFRANLRGVDLRCADFSGSDLTRADLSNAKTGGSDLSGAVLRYADLSHTVLGDFIGADMKWAKLTGVRAASVDGGNADLSNTDLKNASFTHVDLQHARLNGAYIDGATFSDCRVFGTAAWGLRGTPAKESGLFVTPISADIRPPTGRDMRQREEQYDSALTVDRIEFAPLVFSVLNRDRFSEVINTFTSKVVLILGRFASPRMLIIQAVREQLARNLYLPVVFDFAAPWRRDLTETISTLSHLSRFVIADLTDAKSIPHELSQIVPFLPSVPVVPILLRSEGEPYAMFEHFARYPWVLDLVQYNNVDELLAKLERSVVQPAETFSRKIRDESAHYISL